MLGTHNVGLAHQVLCLRCFALSTVCVCRQRLKLLTSPTEEWGPALVKYRKLVDYVPGFVTDPWGTGTKQEPLDYDNMAVESRSDIRVRRTGPTHVTAES